MTKLEELFASLDQRWRPEDVALSVLHLLPKRTPEEKQRLAAVARHSRQATGLNHDFAQVCGMDRQLDKAGELAGLTPPDGLDLPGIAAFIEAFEASIGKTVGRSDFKADRLNREARRAAGLVELSRRQYNKRFRVAARLERKQATVGTELEKRAFTQMSKSRLANRITWEAFRADVTTACFVAYFAARCNRRSVFTNQSQDRPYDDVADLLFQRLKRQPGRTDWWTVALVYPERAVLEHLTSQQQGQLLGLWYSALARLTELLRDVWERSRIHRETMIVRKGNDSSTWNLLAGAWNKARDAWFALLFALEAEGLLERQCPGKVLRLMAADVAAWHRATGGDLDRDTLVWQDLPLPWEVFAGDAECIQADVVEVCCRHGLDPFQSGWAGPLPQGQVHPFRPTPELVHGVVVASPELAALFRRHGVFSGKDLRGDLDELVAFDETIDQVRREHRQAQGPWAKGATGIDRPDDERGRGR